MASRQDGILPSGTSPKFLQSTSTAHNWIFSAFAELIDNAYDPGVSASELRIEKLDCEGTPYIMFLDNGAGMNKNKLYKMLSFGYCDKRESEPKDNRKPIGQFGLGFKLGSMRIGKDALVFTRTKDSASIGFLSQTYLEAIKAESRKQTQEIENNLEAILNYSLFSTEKKLKKELKALEESKSKTGTKILISNLVQLPDDQLELDFISYPTDILCREEDEPVKSAVKNKISNLVQLPDDQLELDFISYPTDILCREEDEPVKSAVKNKPEDEPVKSAVKNKPEDEPVKSAVKNKPEDEPVKSAVKNKPEDEPVKSAVKNKPEDEPVKSAVKNKPEDEPVKSAVKNKPEAPCPLNYKSSLREYCKILYLKPKMKIYINGEKVTPSEVLNPLKEWQKENYHPRNEKQIEIKFGFTSGDDKTEDYGMLLYHRNRLIKAYVKVGCQKRDNTHGIGVVGVAEVDFLKPIYTKQDFIKNRKFYNAIRNFGDKLDRYWMDKTERPSPNSGKKESQDPATNLKLPKGEINSGILDNPQSPVNQNQTQNTEEPTSTVHAQREMSATQEIEELKKLMYTFLKLSYPESDLGDINDIGQWVQDFIRNKVKIFIMTVLLCGG
ncbi:hypothetical protein RRG08_021046 [Elysia crispata]|uniref:Morc S5 domain-containing protein n=1 Tax=Elysia crispata TaxID=231223 RepID=A0AAE1D362_9GAST|nr:hypothetical protein RRG08_021046 [Elysia crispata]